jgi:hypothetical protein
MVRDWPHHLTMTLLSASVQYREPDLMSCSYAWDENFTIKGFKKAIDDYNREEFAAFKVWAAPLNDSAILPVARVTYASSAAGALSGVGYRSVR